MNAYLLLVACLLAFAAANNSTEVEEKCPGSNDPSVVDGDDDDCAEEGSETMRPDLFEGDIMLPKQSNKESKEDVQMSAVISARSKWPKSSDGKVYIAYTDNQASSQARPAIKSAIESYAKNTCIRFVKRTNQRDFIRFFVDNGCYSRIGKTGGEQEISLGRGCEHHATAVHEIMHAIGFLHEQSRPDRDQHVKVMWQNIQQGMDSQFQKGPTNEFTTQGLRYDHSSVMHYPANAFSKNGQNTLESIPAGIRLGNRKGFTQLDIEKVNKLYNCDNSGGETPGTEPTPEPWTPPPPRTTVRTPPPQGCRDTMPTRVCNWYIRRYPSFCRSSSQSSRCQKSCGRCTDGGCEDSSHKCRWASQQDPNFCSGIGKVFCPATCNACDVGGE